jgi:hypothetical protein
VDHHVRRELFGGEERFNAPDFTLPGKKYENIATFIGYRP